ncbi:MAG: hypothetical protein IJ323_03935 [Clostridia bacterium]|nr:hypothetical protein [Clostridia bacterium]
MKTKLGISIGLLAALTYFAALFSGFGLALIFLAGYILLVESDEWLKRMAVKAVVFTVTMTVLYWIVSIIPGLFGVINDFIALFNGEYFSIEWISDIVDILHSVISFVENIVLILLGIKALSKSTIYIPVIDGMVNKFLG